MLESDESFIAIFYGVRQWKNFENRSNFCKDTKIWLHVFFTREVFYNACNDCNLRQSQVYHF